MVLEDRQKQYIVARTLFQLKTLFFFYLYYIQAKFTNSIKLDRTSFNFYIL